MDNWERRPAQGHQRDFSGPTAIEIADVVRRLGGVCDHCKLDIPSRRTTIVTRDLAGRRVGLCNDCRQALRADKIHRHIHGGGR